MAKTPQKFDSRQKMSKKTFEVFHYKDAKLNTVDIHHHDFYEIYYFLGGDVSYLIEGKKYKLSVGDLVFISPMELHQPIVNSGSTYERVVLWIDRSFLASISDENTDFSSCFHGVGNNGGNIFHTSVLMRGRLYELLEHLFLEAYGENFGHERYAEGILLQLLCEFRRMIDENNEIQSASNEPPSLIGRVTSYINNHYNEDISLESLAKKHFVNKYYLSHEFTDQLGIGVYRYLTLKRLSIAKELLSEGIAASEVSTKCGFHNYATFYRAFKAEYGISPSNFVNE